MGLNVLILQHNARMFVIYPGQEDATGCFNTVALLTGPFGSLTLLVILLTPKIFKALKP